MSVSPAVLQGGCLCGKIRYSSTSFPAPISNCCCVECRKASGNAYQAFARFPRSSITWLTQEPNYFRSSKFARRGFCDSCGASLTFEVDALPESISITPGSINDWNIEDVENKLAKPSRYIYTGEKPAWFDIPQDGLDRYHADNESNEPNRQG